MAKRDENNSSNEIAEKSFDPSDYCSKNEVEKGLAITHEQVSDTYTEGTIEGEIDNIEKKLKEYPHRISK
ncbi:MAG: YozQ family protein [Anaerobacillus sp.]|uniref:YozQ family protein n=1 Tax=Anaerobacillus sp. TaxID=1872506 RepID=UPI00391C6F98